MTTTPAVGRIPTYGSWGKRPRLIPGMSTFHRGVDIAASAGTPVVAPQAGTVTTSSYNLIRGHYVIVDHGRYQTLSQHLSKRLVVKGERVTEGQLIGLMGRTGNVTGVHDHTEVRDHGTPIDPTPWYAARGVTLGAPGTAVLAEHVTALPAPTLSDPEEDNDMYEFIKLLYRELMNREPDSVGAAGWLDYGREHGAKALRERFLASPPERGTVVAAFHAYGINHEPNATDYAGYLALANVAEVWRQVAESPEGNAYAARAH